MPKVKIVRNQEIAEIPIKEAGEARVATPFLRRVSSENIREEELGAIKTKINLSTITFSQQLALVDNGQLTIRIHITVTNVKKLSDRENEVLSHVVRGKTSKEIGMQLDISRRTVEHHIENIKYKTNCHSKAELINLYWSRL